MAGDVEEEEVETAVQGEGKMIVVETEARGTGVEVDEGHSRPEGKAMLQEQITIKPG